MNRWDGDLEVGNLSVKNNLELNFPWCKNRGLYFDRCNQFLNSPWSISHATLVKSEKYRLKHSAIPWRIRQEMGLLPRDMLIYHFDPKIQNDFEIYSIHSSRKSFLILKFVNARFYFLHLTSSCTGTFMCLASKKEPEDASECLTIDFITSMVWNWWAGDISCTNLKIKNWCTCIQ